MLLRPRPYMDNGLARRMSKGAGAFVVWVYGVPGLRLHGLKGFALRDVRHPDELRALGP